MEFLCVGSTEPGVSSSTKSANCSGVLELVGLGHGWGLINS